MDDDDGHYGYTGRPDGGFWLAIHPGLLTDELFRLLPDRGKVAWLILFLAADDEPARGSYKDEARAIYRLRIETGWSGAKAKAAVAILVETGWLGRDPGSGRLALRKWRYYQTAGRKSLQNQSRGDRSAEYVKTAARKRGQRRAAKTEEPRRSMEEPGGDQDKTPPLRGGLSVPAREDAGGAGTDATDLRPLREILEGQIPPLFMERPKKERRH